MNQTIQKTFTFEAGHRLQNHAGKDIRLHGHSYKVDVAVTGGVNQQRGSSQGMVVDFSEISAAMKRVLDVVDHHLILEHKDPIIDALQDSGYLDHIVIFPWPPTAENLSKWIFEKVYQTFQNMVDYIRVWETPTSWARYDNPNPSAS